MILMDFDVAKLCQTRLGTCDWCGHLLDLDDEDTYCPNCGRNVLGYDFEKGEPHPRFKRPAELRTMRYKYLSHPGEVICLVPFKTHVAGEVV